MTKQIMMRLKIKKALNDIKWSERFLDKGVEEIWKIFIDMS